MAYGSSNGNGSANGARVPEFKLKEQMCEIGRRIWLKGYCAGNEGNHSVRIGENRVLCTPTGVSKGFLKPDMITVVDMEGKQIDTENKWKRTSEILMHLTIYRMRPDVGAVVHAHPCTATGFASAGIALDEPVCSEVVITLGSVPLAPYATTGSTALSDSLCPYIPFHDAILMANHGVVSYGEDLCRAYMRMEAVEHYAKVVLTARLLGSARSLDSQELEKLVAVRSQYGKNGN